MTSPPNTVPTNAPAAAPAANPPMDLPANLAEELQDLRERLQEHETRAAYADRVIIMLRAHNRALQQRLNEARNIQRDDASTVSSQSSENL